VERRKPNSEQMYGTSASGALSNINALKTGTSGTTVLFNNDVKFLVFHNVTDFSFKAICYKAQ
jgi:hypothetical protein